MLVFINNLSLGAVLPDSGRSKVKMTKGINMRVNERKQNRPITRLVIGARYGQWTVMSVALPLVEVRCSCGHQQSIRCETLRHGHSSKCKQCRAAAKRGKRGYSLNNIPPSQVWEMMRGLSQLQMAYMAKLIRNCKFIEGESLTKSHLIEALELARLSTPAQMEAELTPVVPLLEVRQSYSQYQSPKGGSL